MKKLIFSRRDASKIGVTMHFHNLTSMSIFDQIVRPELTRGIWSKSTSNSEIWSSPNYYLVGDKSEVSTKFDYVKDKSRIKRNQNLKRILRNQDTLDACLNLGRLAKGTGVRVIKFLKFDNITKVLSIFPKSINEINDISEMKMSLIASNPELSECIDLFTQNDISDYYKSEYYGKELKDDFGMIQNVMRTDYINNPNDIESEDDEEDELTTEVPFDYSED